MTVAACEEETQARILPGFPRQSVLPAAQGEAARRIDLGRQCVRALRSCVHAYSGVAHRVPPALHAYSCLTTQCSMRAREHMARDLNQPLRINGRAPAVADLLPLPLGLSPGGRVHPGLVNRSDRRLHRRRADLRARKCNVCTANRYGKRRPSQLFVRSTNGESLALFFLLLPLRLGDHCQM